MSRLKIEVSKLINYFKSRDEYRIELRKCIKKYGFANLPASVQRTVPTDMKVLYEIKWWMQPFVWFRIFQTAWLRAESKGLRRALHG